MCPENDNGTRVFPERRVFSVTRLKVSLPELLLIRVLVPVVVRLERAFRIDADVGRLVRAQLGKRRADLAQMQHRDLLIEMLRQRVDLRFILARVGPKFDLR